VKSPSAGARHNKDELAASQWHSHELGDVASDIKSFPHRSEQLVRCRSSAMGMGKTIGDGLRVVSSTRSPSWAVERSVEISPKRLGSTVLRKDSLSRAVALQKRRVRPWAWGQESQFNSRTGPLHRALRRVCRLNPCLEGELHHLHRDNGTIEAPSELTGSASAQGGRAALHSTATSSSCLSARSGRSQALRGMDFSILSTAMDGPAVKKHRTAIAYCLAHPPGA